MKYTLLTNLSSLVEAELNFHCREGISLECWCSVMSLLTGVKHLNVQNMWFKVGFFSYTSHFSHLKFINTEIESSERFAFKNLSRLELKAGYTESDLKGLAVLFVWSPGLETLVLDYVYDMDKVTSYGYFLIKQCLFDIPSLRKVEMKNFINTDIELSVLLLIKMRKVVLETVMLTPSQLVKTSFKGFLVFDLNTSKFRRSDS
ncbi:hypothetical protein ACH5RR_028993 [Cinchona calisaya]|uniref:Uncharacterized protein n=1 Tax=Cinchona calisaya TaxID=153742 RepID=A0ABD2YQD8_9GENT